MQQNFNERALFARDSAPQELQDDRKHGIKHALTIKGLWAWLVATGYKDIENRTWNTRFRGRFYITMSKNCTLREYGETFKFVDSIDSALAQSLPDYKTLMKNFAGKIIGSVNLLDVFPPPKIGDVTSPWHIEGNFGFKLVDAVLFPNSIPVKGQLGFFQIPTLETKIIEEIEKEIQ